MTTQSTTSTTGSAATSREQSGGSATGSLDPSVQGATPAGSGRHRVGSEPGRGAGASTAYRLTMMRVLNSEWIKLRTLRGTWIGLGAVLAVLIGIGAIAAAVSTGSVTPDRGGGPPRGTGPLSTVLLGANFGVLLIGVLGCLAGAREYGSRMITATVAAVPRRWQVVVAKAAALGAVVVPVALLGVFGAFFIGMAVLSGGGGATVALSDPGIVRSLIGTALYLCAIALLGLGLGVLLRSTAASIGVLIGGVLILPGIAGALLPSSWSEVLKYLPTNAAASFTSTTPPAGDLSAGPGAIVLVAWVVLALGAATVAIRRRDV